MLNTRCRAKREQLKRFQVVATESQDQILVLAVLYVPRSLDSGRENSGSGSRSGTEDSAGYEPVEEKDTIPAPRGLLSGPVNA